MIDDDEEEVGFSKRFGEVVRSGAVEEFLEAYEDPALVNPFSEEELQAIREYNDYLRSNAFKQLNEDIESGK
jgi:hypothetical protein